VALQIVFMVRPYSLTSGEEMRVPGLPKTAARNANAEGRPRRAAVDKEDVR
jgi:hypothetical protein